MGKTHEHFIADTGHNGQHCQMEKETQEEIADGHQDIQHQEQEDADEKDDEQESGAAAGMKPGKGLRVFRREGQIRLMAVDGFVFRAVVLERTADFRHAAAEDHIADQQQDFHQAADEGVAHRGNPGTAQQGFNPRGQGNEQGDGKHYRQHDGEGHDDFIHAFTQLRGEPFFEFSGLFIQHAEHLGGILQGIHAVIQHGTHIDDPADKGFSHPGVLFLERDKGGQFGDKGSVRTADCDGGGIGGAHHDAFHDRLTAYVEFLFLFCIHQRKTSFP